MFSFLANLFVNPALVGGVLAGSIPVIIHLLNRQRFKKVVWAAMHWLWASYKKSQRRLQIEQLLLLLIRVLLLILLALALARPSFQQNAGLLGGRPATHRIIVLDNSYSMGQLVGGQPLFNRAKDLALELGGQLGTSDELDLILANSGSDDIGAGTTALPRKDVLNHIKSAAVSDGTTDVPKSVALACRLLNERKSGHSRKEIIVITDRTRAGWEAGDRQIRRVTTEDEQAITKAMTSAKPRVIVIRLQGEKDGENAAAAQLEVEEKVIPARVETQLLGQVRTFGTTPIRNVKVKLKINGEEAASEMIDQVTPDKVETVIFRHLFPEAGSYAVSMELDSDLLPNDNTAFLAVDVEDQLRVLCVDGQQRVGANSSETDYFRQALAPSKADEVKAGKMPLLPEIISDSAFPEANLDNYRLVMLANVASVPKEKVDALQAFVQRGGALWIFVGDRVDPAIYNRELAGLLPATLGDLVGSGDPEGQFEALSDKESEHPAIQRFKGIRGLPLSQLHTYRRYRLVPTTGNEAGLRTVLSYDNGEPAAIERLVGDRGGRVMIFGTTADRAWNNWPAKNQFMPLMNYLALDLIQPAYLQRNRMHGEKIVMQLPRQDVGAARREGIRLVDPSGDTSAMEILTEQSAAESAPLKRAGIYNAEIPGDTRRTLHFAVNRNLDESDLNTIEDREIITNLPRSGEASTEGAGYFRGAITQSDLVFAPPEMRAIEEELKKSAGNREIWRWLVAAVLVLLLIESLLARRFGDFNR